MGWGAGGGETLNLNPGSCDSDWGLGYLGFRATVKGGWSTQMIHGLPCHRKRHPSSYAKA